MLRENPLQRPNIYQVLRDVSAMRGTDIPIKDVRPLSLIVLQADSTRSMPVEPNRNLEEINICRRLNRAWHHRQ